MNARLIFLAPPCWLMALAAAPSQAAPIRVTTWDLQPGAVAGTNGWSDRFQQSLVQDAAESLKKLRPDVIMLQQVADWETCQQLAQALQPETYQVVICSSFRDPSAKLLSRQVAILSKAKGYLAWSEPWQNSNASPAAPGGFAFAAIRLGNKNIGFFSVQFSDGVSSGTEESRSAAWQQARGESARQLVKQIDSLQDWKDNRLQTFIVAGDFDTTPDDLRLVDEKTLSLLEQAGFDNASAGLPLEKRVTLPGDARRPAATLDYIFTRDAGLVGPVLMTPGALCEHEAVTCEMDLAAPKATPALPPLAASNAPPAPPPLAASNVTPTPPPLAESNAPPAPPPLAESNATPAPPPLAESNAPPAPPLLAAPNAPPAPPPLAESNVTPAPPPLAASNVTPTPPPLAAPNAPPVPPPLATVVLNRAFDGRIYESRPSWDVSLTNQLDVNELMSARIFAADSNPNAAKKAAPPALTYPPRDPQAKPGLIDLTAYYNAALTESWHGNAKDDLAPLPTGVQNLAGVDYDVRGIVQVGSKERVAEGIPTRIDGIKIRQKCARLHFLHSAGFGSVTDEGQQVGSYIVHFANHRMPLEIPIIYGRDVRNWHRLAGEKPSTDLNPAWRGSNAVRADSHYLIRLFTATWVNVAPGVEIESIDFVSSMGKVAPFLIAITVE